MARRVFLYGDLGSGKSTVSATIFRYFRDRRNAAIQLDVLNNPSGAQYFQQWMDDLERGEFPVKTEHTTFLQVNLGIYLRDSGEQFGLSFFEASGEEIVKISPIHPNHSSLQPDVPVALESADLFILVIPCDADSNAARRMHAFVSLLQALNFVDKPVAFVMTCWDRGRGKISDRVLVRERFKDSLSLLLSNAFSGEVELFKFSVGMVDAGSSPPKVKAVMYTAGAEQLSNWMLAQFRGV